MEIQIFKHLNELHLTLNYLGLSWVSKFRLTNLVTKILGSAFQVYLTHEQVDFPLIFFSSNWDNLGRSLEKENECLLWHFRKRELYSAKYLLGFKKASNEVIKKICNNFLITLNWTTLIIKKFTVKPRRMISLRIY